MMRKIFRLLSFMLVIAAFAVTARAQTQTVFNLEEGVRREAPIPDAVIAVLKSERRADDCFRQKGEGADETAWFAASEIDLNADRRMDLVIVAKDACLFGANQAPFWVFQNARDGYRKVLSASGLQLAVLPKKANAFRRIKISKVVSMKLRSEIYSFRAGKYQPARR